MEHSSIKVAVGLSGGVDSSVAAVLLLEQGYDVTGLFMQIYDGSVAIKRQQTHACFGPDEQEDMASAAAVCEKLAIPFHVVDLKKEYRNHVIEYFTKEYLTGRTPNPCVACNRKLKFGFLLEKARNAGLDFSHFATGHYAQIKESRNRFLLKKSVDPLKDQTYFLYTLSQEQLAHTFFPLGKHTKNQVREFAHALNLETADRPESQDFIAGGHYVPLFSEKEIMGGDIVNKNGNIIGKHKGIVHYTVGQRRGLGIASDQPLYVLEIDAPNNRIVVGKKEKLLSKGLIAKDLNLIAIEKLDRPYRVKAKIRLKHKGANAIVRPFKANRAEILFEEPQLSVTPGQSAVLYQDGTVLGGGIIERAL